MAERTMSEVLDALHDAVEAVKAVRDEVYDKVCSMERAHAVAIKAQHHKRRVLERFVGEQIEYMKSGQDSKCPGCDCEYADGVGEHGHSCLFVPCIDACKGGELLE